MAEDSPYPVYLNQIELNEITCVDIDTRKASDHTVIDLDDAAVQTGAVHSKPRKQSETSRTSEGMISDNFNELLAAELDDLQKRVAQHHASAVDLLHAHFNRKFQEAGLTPEQYTSDMVDGQLSTPTGQPRISFADEYRDDGQIEARPTSSQRKSKGSQAVRLYNGKSEKLLRPSFRITEVRSVKSERSDRSDRTKLRVSQVLNKPALRNTKSLYWGKKTHLIEGQEELRVTEAPSLDQDEVIRMKTNASIPEYFEDWQRRLVTVFVELDDDNSGSLNTDELRSALRAAGVPQARLKKLIQVCDKDGNGEIEFHEWLAAIRDTGSKDMALLSAKFHENKMKFGSFLGDVEKSASPCMIRPNSPLRFACDFIIFCCCIYLAGVLPFSVAFDDDFEPRVERTLQNCDRGINYVFIVDLILNFRTGYLRGNGELELDPWNTAKHYMRTWFFFDLLTSFPFEDLTDTLPNLQAVKVLKLGKLLRMVKLMKVKTVNQRSMGYLFDDVIQSKIFKIVRRKYSIFLQTLIVCHWLACGMKICDQGWLTSNGGIWSEYLSAVYWAMTTLTTVGYGDITPSTNREIGYTIVAMVIGGAFYGYVVGAVTSLVSDSDLNASAYYSRMDLIDAWVSHHRLPSDMQKSLRRFFDTFMREKAALSDAEVWHDLSPELQRSVGAYLIPENVKSNPLFDGMSMGAVVQLQSILRTFSMTAGSIITTAGEVGTAMYVIDTGFLQMRSLNGTVTKLGPGQSFGEEIVLGLAEGYGYTVVVLEDAHLEMILESEFLHAFQTLPRQLQRMRLNALELNPEWEDGSYNFMTGKTD